MENNMEMPQKINTRTIICDETMQSNWRERDCNSSKMQVPNSREQGLL